MPAVSGDSQYEASSRHVFYKYTPWNSQGAGNGPILPEISQVSHTPWDQTYFFAQKYTSIIEAVSINLKDIFL